MHTKLIVSNIGRKLFANKRKRLHKCTIVAEYYLFSLSFAFVTQTKILARYTEWQKRNDSHMLIAPTHAQTIKIFSRWKFSCHCSEKIRFLFINWHQNRIIVDCALLLNVNLLNDCTRRDFTIATRRMKHCEPIPKPHTMQITLRED